MKEKDVRSYYSKLTANLIINLKKAIHNKECSYT